MKLIRLMADYKARISGITRTFLISVMILAFITNAMGENGTSVTVTEKNRENTRLGTAGLSDPDAPADKDTPWSGSYVYFGTWDGNPIRFRVLAKDSTAYTTGEALFLDSDV